MQRRTVTCDRCEVVVAKDWVLLVVRAGALPRLKHGRGIDLCGKCGQDFDAWLGEAKNLDPAAIRDDEPPDTGGPF